MRKGFFFAVGASLLSAAVVRVQAGPPVDLRATLLAPVMYEEDANKDGKLATAQAKLPEAKAPATDKKAKKPAPLPASVTQPPQDAFADPGRRYPAVWASADYLLWFVRSGPVNGPLVTTGSPLDKVPAALGQPNTQAIFGNSPLDYNPLSGARFNLGVRIAPNVGIEGNYFLLERGAATFNMASDAAGTPLFGRPFFDTFLGIPNSALTSAPGAFAGSTTIASHTHLQGYELNLAGNLVQNPGMRFDVLAGFRALDLNEDLLFQDAFPPPGTINFNFGPAVVPPGATVIDFDKFRTTNHFYGGQAGGRLQWFYGRFSVGMTAKLALGGTQQLAIIDGASSLLVPGMATMTLPGGVLAQTSNIGRYYRDQFSVVPEGQLNFGWQVRPQVRVNVGYTFLYWSNVLRPGAQIDRNVNSSLIPTSQTFGMGAPGGPPFFSFHSSDFWAQGVNFGVQIAY
jgi:hypothetical protein